MDSHLFREIIVTEGAAFIYATPIDEDGVSTEFYEGKNKRSVAIIVDPMDDDIDSMTGSTLLEQLGMNDIATLLFPKFKPVNVVKSESVPVVGADLKKESDCDTCNGTGQLQKEQEIVKCEVCSGTGDKAIASSITK
ncbi:MAG TPA: hypothetical protein VN698_12535 [Bacteroidia bacterium]|nr:hypothetical protein [Bacteroidia bacterium]